MGAATEGQTLATESLQTSTMLRVSQSTTKFLRSIVNPVLKNHFKRDEFLGRINEMVVFHCFDEGDLGEIVEKELTSWASKAKARHNMSITWSEKVVNRLCLGYNEQYGFRSLKNEVEQQVVNTIAYSHERNLIKRGCSFQ